MVRVSAPPPVFLDRDGTLIVEKHYLGNPDEVSLEAGVIEGLAMLQDRGHALVVLSNQSGIGRGMFAERDARRVNDRVAELLRNHGIHVLAWYICPHSPDEGCACRKPRPGMAIAASQDWNLELKGSYVIGDKRADLELADAIGGRGILVTTGQGATASGWARGQSRPVFESLREAAVHIVRQDALRPASPDGSGVQGIES